MDYEYEKLISRMNPPRVVIDNSACENATVIKVNCVNKHGILFEVVQFLTDLKLIIRKSYISSDGAWFMDGTTEGLEWRELHKSSRPQVAPLDCFEMDYTVVTMRSKDRPKLMFDTVCTVTDLEYVVFHRKIDTGNMEAYQEYYIRHKDGIPVSTEAERQRVTQCLEAAIERRASEGLELQLRTDDPLEILSDITRIFRENGLTIKTAEISTTGGKVIGTLYVTDVSSHPVDAKTIDSIRQQIGQTILRVKQSPFLSSKPPREQATGCLFRNFFKALSLQNFGLTGSFS